MDQAHIVVIDRDPTFLRLMEELLEGEGFAVTASADGEHAHTLIAGRRPELVLLDVHLGQPGQGMRLLHQLEADPRTAEIPILVCSADARLLLRLPEPFSARGHDIVEKPFDIDHLLCRVRGLLRPLSGCLRDG